MMLKEVSYENNQQFSCVRVVFILVWPRLFFLLAFPTCGFYMQFTFLCFSFFSCFRIIDFWPFTLDMQVSSNMEGQLVLTRPESPVITIISTTSYNPSQSIAGHLVFTTSNMVQNVQTNQPQQFSVIKNVIQNEQQQQQQPNNSKSRICRDFVRGSCRRSYCKYPHVQSSDMVVFCHDFQNNKCPRINCK
jgi:hypothetical protein